MAAPTKYLALALNYGAINGIVGTQTVVRVALYDASSGGNLIQTMDLTPHRPLIDTDVLNFAANTLYITTSGGSNSEEGNAAGLQLLDARFGSTTIGPATYYAALMTVAPTGAGGGTELGGTSYARIAITNNPTNFPAATLV